MKLLFITAIFLEINGNMIYNGGKEMFIMEVFEVVNIEEADYGCEECMAGPKALVSLKGREVFGVEMSEEWIAFTGIDKGKSLVLGADGKYRPVVKVAAAVIYRKGKDGTEVFATRRGYGEHKGKWEFPGGKAEKGETTAQAAVREIKEELDVDIKTERLFYTVEYDYPGFHLSMDCFTAVITGGDVVLKEHEAACWLNSKNIEKADWLPADIALTEVLKEMLSE